MMTFGAAGPDRVVVAPDGTSIDVRQGALSIWPKWFALWERGGEWFGGPWEDGGIVPWDHEPTDAEVLAEYDAWSREAEDK